MSRRTASNPQESAAPEYQDDCKEARGLDPPEADVLHATADQSQLLEWREPAAVARISTPAQDLMPSSRFLHEVFSPGAYRTNPLGWAPKAGHIGPRLLGHRCQGTAVGATHVPDLIEQQGQQISMLRVKRHSESAHFTSGWLVGSGSRELARNNEGEPQRMIFLISHA